MPDQPSFPSPQTPEETGRYIVTFRPGAVDAGLAALSRDAGVARLPEARDFGESAVNMAEAEAAGGAVFRTLGMAVVTLDQLSAAAMAEGARAATESPFLAIEPETMVYAAGRSLPSDEAHAGYGGPGGQEGGGTVLGEEDVRTAVVFQDDAQSTWGLKATEVMNSKHTGRGIRVAVLDTGLDLQHPDFRNRLITSKSFIPGQQVQDGNGHGTHCVGTACGHKDANGRRYGVAHESEIYVGKVLSDAGTGPFGGVIAGIEWAVNSGCHVISLSLSAMVPTSLQAAETAGQIALQNGCLVIAAAGNDRPLTVGRPANSPSIMAVAAVDSRLGLASFSCGAGTTPGADIDIAGPGVAVYSSVPMPGRYATFNGTSMATPHVAGIAALWADRSGARGMDLWKLLRANARPLQLPQADVGAGLGRV